MDLRKPKKPICEEFGLINVLETFKAGPFPAFEDVLCHFFFHLRLMKKPDAALAGWNTADSILAHWDRTALPLMTRKNSKTKVVQFYEEYRAILKAKKNPKSYEEKKANFLAKLKTRFDVSAKDALNLIDADKTRNTEEKEDKNFLLALRANRPHSLGALDVKRIKRLDRIAEREHQAKEQAERETERQMVSSLESCFNQIIFLNYIHGCYSRVLLGRGNSAIRLGQ